MIEMVERCDQRQLIKQYLRALSKVLDYDLTQLSLADFGDVHTLLSCPQKYIDQPLICAKLSDIASLIALCDGVI